MKKIIVISLVTLLTTIAVSAQSSLSVTVTNIKEQKGTIRVGLFNSEDNFLKTPVDGKVTQVNGNEATVVFENLKAGEYALSVIHDENENGELDKNGLGIPKEGFGFSNNKMGAFGPPSFDEAHIELPATKSTSMKLKYM